MARALPWAVVGVGVSVASGAWAQRVKHEYVPPALLARLDAAATIEAAIEPGEPLPDAVTRDGQRLAKPDGPAADSPRLTDPEPPPAAAPGIFRPDEAVPDRRTGADGALKYQAVFNPTVAPLRRNVAFDQVEADYRMTVAPSRRVVVPLVPRTVTPGRELFWGDLRVEFRGRDEPVPSVAPDMRILAVEIEPAVPVTFVRDAADNFYVRSAATGDVRLKFLVDADSAYFSAPVPGTVPLSHGRDHPAAQLPPRAQAAARQVFARIGLDPDQPFDRGLDVLVAWFRAFRAGPPPSGSGDIYLDLALGQVGVCRHRAFAFMVTARAAGVPTRVLHNEAHAFVEVLAPDGRWRRIDLGGEAPELSIEGGEKRRLHTPPPDPFAKPPAFLAQYSSMLTQGVPPGTGPAPGSQGEGTSPEIVGAPPRLGGEAPTEGDPSPGPTSGGEAPFASGVAAAEVPLPSLEAPAEVGETAQVDVEPVALVRVTLDQPNAEYESFRGETSPVALSGRVQTVEGGAAVPGVRVQLHLLPVGPGQAVAAGPAVTSDPDGRFVFSVRLSPTLGLGRYRVVAASEATDRFAAGRSDAPR
ncbi:MAG: hypothetical protein KC620_17950 [Myxococcales bacterium]|nr:hypothetical protein [Myxococcales bacterium]